MNLKTLLFAIAGGVVLTLLTGLLPNMAPMLVGATHYGYPLAWLTRLIIAPEYFPWQVGIGGLVIDILFWTAIVGAALFILSRMKKSSNP